MQIESTITTESSFFRLWHCVLKLGPLCEPFLRTVYFIGLGTVMFTPKLNIEDVLGKKGYVGFKGLEWAVKKRKALGVIFILMW